MSVYFAQAGDAGPIKIGFASDVEKRLAGLQTGNPEPIRLLNIVPDGTRSLEARIHAKFGEHRLRGEWFRPAPEVLEFVADPQVDPDPDPYPLPPMAAALWEAVERAGGQAPLARLIGVSQQNIWAWLHNSRRCKAEFALSIERETGVSRHRLRPDLFIPFSEAA
ncbi:hypothetical protein HBA54_27285 [Pelagibius litoralis]|uniref:HTH cro/C1-type domain-containing protein n=1 Tax=Pelagibius litoralis TaxID=374515 RepID=A0A967KF87_9PROT|nr:YdaS family helix-turn-helix protein [Pelagibius litoralis]NIA72299.1 hypothetical protein [Pelagibius litoralis]